MNSRGFTLIELMIAVLIVGILAAIAFPSFTAQLNKSRRSEGITALLELQQTQSRLRANCRFYAQVLNNENNDGTNDSLCDTITTSAIEIATTTPQGYYTLSIEPGSASGNTYTARAAAAGSQVGDTDCSTILLRVNTADVNGIADPDGLKRSINSSNVEADNDSCW